MKRRYLFACSAFFLVLLLAGCGKLSRNAFGGRAATTIQVTETDFHIDASVTNFSPGITYHFIITNTGQTAHEFMIMPKTEGNMTGMQMGDMDKMALASIGDLNPGETKTLDYVFPSSAADSHPELACYLPGHYEAGMKQAVAITS